MTAIRSFFRVCIGASGHTTKLAGKRTHMLPRCSYVCQQYLEYKMLLGGLKLEFISSQFYHDCHFSGSVTYFCSLPVPRNCPKNRRWMSAEEHNITENGTVYRCAIEGSLIRKKFCSTGCTLKNKTMCCRIKFVEKRMRNFTCSPVEGDGPVISKTLKVFQERKCQCFSCSDVCPVPEQAANITNSVQNKFKRGSSDYHATSEFIVN